jgi:EAL domain-containing protein (putative c-di-GMP-specific phosphodiesterase class I)
MTESTPKSEARGSVLCVDDEPAILRAVERALREAGLDVVTADDGLAARERLAERTFDVILSDISMPGLDGIGLLRAVREKDLDVPVVLMTGAPSAESAYQAVAHGATMYLVKPVGVKELRAVVERAVSMHRMAKLKREFLEHFGSPDHVLADHAGTEIIVTRGLAKLWMAYQPIVDAKTLDVVAYECLLRTDEPSLKSPIAFLDAVERVGRLDELGRTIRGTVASAAAQVPLGLDLFVNLHARDFADPTLVERASPLSQIASRVVLEVTERAPLDRVPGLEARLDLLRGLGYRLAIDDLGAGYAGLTAFVQVRPNVAKIDMALVRDVDKEPVKQRLVTAVVSLCHDMGIVVVAEGVETASERDRLRELGVDRLQGYLLGKPERRFDPRAT